MGVGSPMSAADRAGSSDGLENLARVGLLAYGVVHLVLAWLALQLAWGGGGSSESPDQSGALATLADSPVGKPLLWVVAIGMIALAVWQLAEVLRWRSGWSASGDRRKKAVTKSVKAVVKAVVYAALAVLAIRTVTGSGGSGGQQEQQATEGVFGLPAGRWLVGLAGLVLIGVGLYYVHKGVTKRFLEQLDLSSAAPGTRRLVERVGLVGFPAKGIAFTVLGGMLVYAAVTFDPNKAAGLDGAMRTILDAPFGQFLLTLVALGIAAYGVFCLIRARYPERT
ncbi:DUF1206 domain-containing protein [Trujillonella endophytica]|uniref:DUF1206 domain-containing protein n=1 Tax=Trujillonella endophytica TaxID=673521 RepID=A0A1H8VK03_9ACTN|nr:DUF1206 domain-containing protein [Trujillella endophytica]SEP15735.1 protein of unknown function [Trujillella endophytica]